MVVLVVVVEVVRENNYLEIIRVFVPVLVLRFITHFLDFCATFCVHLHQCAALEPGYY